MDVPKPIKPPRRIKNVGYVALNVTDLARALDFYSRCCNLVPVYEESGYALLRSKYEHHCVALYSSNASSLRHIGFETNEDSATEQLKYDLQKMNVPIREAESIPGRLGLAFQFQDPEGNWVEVYKCLSRLPGIVSQGAFNIERLGHFTMLSKDIMRLCEFYRQIGFRISDRSPRGVFTRCGTDHHGLAFLPSDRSTLHHHAFDLGDWEQIKLLLDWMFKHGVVPEAGPGRHGPGNNIAVYIRDPDGFRVEFYCEMEQIYDDEDHERDYPVKMFNLWLRKPAPESFHV